MSSLAGKKYLIIGLANEKSIAWGIAKALHREGAELAFTYLNEALEKRVRPLAEELGSKHVYKCDVQSDQEIDQLFKDLGAAWSGLDGLVHAVAYAEKEDLQNRFHTITRSGFQLAMDVSAYSLIAVCGKAAPMLMANKGSVVTLTYLGSEKVVKNYNVMGVAKAALECCVRYLAADLGESGVRVNAISAGPIKTLAASGIPQFREMLNSFADKAPLKKNVTQEEVGEVAAFLLSDKASGISGETMYVDAGFNIMGA